MFSAELHASESTNEQDENSTPLISPALVADLESLTVSRERALPQAPTGREDFDSFQKKLNGVVIDAASRLLSLDDGKRTFKSEDSSAILSSNPSLIGDEHFFLTETPPEEFRRTGVLRPLSNTNKSGEYYLVDHGEETESFNHEFDTRRDVYLLRFQIDEGEQRHHVRIDSYECSRGQSDALKSVIEQRLFEAEHPKQKPLHQPKVLPPVDEASIEESNQMIHSDWSHYCWKERFRKLWTTAVWIGSVVGAVALMVTKIPEATLEKNVWADIGVRLGLNLLGFGGLNLVMNNITDIKTASKLDDIAAVIRGKKSSEEELEALSKLRASDFEFLAQRVESGNVNLSIGFRTTVHTETVLEDSEGVELLRTIGAAALKHRDDLMMRGIFVPTPDWFAVRLGAHISAKENEKNGKKLAHALMETVEQFRAVSWKNHSKMAA